MATPEQQRAAVIEACKRYGVTVTRHGDVFRLQSPHVDIWTRDLSLVRPIELKPYTPSR